MTPSEYQKQVVVTESRDFSNKSYIGKIIYKIYNFIHKDTLSARFIKERNIRLLHASMGLVTEIGELLEMLDKSKLDLTNLREECSDSTWYIGVATDELDIDLEHLMKKGYFLIRHYKVPISEEFKRVEIQQIINSSFTSACKFLDLVKKGVFYGRDIPEDKIEILLEEVMTQMMLLLTLGGFDVEQAFDVNIAKLQKKRFKSGKFTNSEAIIRNLEEERKTLEGKD